MTVSRTLFFSLPLLALVACSNDSDVSDNSTSISSASKAAQSCLAKYADSPCKLLSVDLVEPYAPDGQELVHTEQDMAGMQCSYSWEGPRTKTVGSGSFKMDVPVNDVVELSQIEPNGDRELDIVARQFAHRYQQTLEQKTAAAEQASERAAEAVGEEHADMARDFAKSLMTKMQFEQIQGVGDDAAWGGIGSMKTVTVRVGKTTFSVNVARSDDEAVRKKESTELAKRILDKCS